MHRTQLRLLERAAQASDERLPSREPVDEFGDEPFGNISSVLVQGAALPRPA